MTKHEADVIGGLNMTDQISNEAYKQIMIAAQDENEVGDVLDKIRAEIDFHSTTFIHGERYIEKDFALDIIDKYRKEQEKVDDYRDRLDELEREEYYESKYRKEQE